MTAYARPVGIDAALELLATAGAQAMGGGTDLAGQLDRGLSSPELLVDLQAAGLDEIRTDGEGILIGAMVTLTRITDALELAPYAAVVEAATQAASAPLRNVGTIGGNLCQGTRCWYYRGEEWNCWLSGGDTCYAQIGDHRKHNLEPGDCISAHPSDLAPALIACGARVIIRAVSGEREVDLLQLYRRPTDDDRSLVTLRPGELIAAVRLPSPPAASTYLRLGLRAAFSFPLVGVAAARRDRTTRLAAAGLANVPVALDLSDPLRGLPGNPQSAWKRDVVSALVDRARTAVEGDLDPAA
jgi:CO/xanthine dehydrogenase FAD-binding subunit